MSFTLLLQILKALVRKSITQYLRRLQLILELNVRRHKPVYLDPSSTGACTGCHAPPTSQHNPWVHCLTSSHEIWDVTFIGQSPSSTWGGLQCSALSRVCGVIWHRSTICVPAGGKPSPFRYRPASLFTWDWMVYFDRKRAVYLQFPLRMEK